MQDDSQNSAKGRGWHGDSAGHARAGKKGGKARARANKAQQGISSMEDSDFE